jgi:16S rRNA pseudouridine516 synthase
VGGSIIIMRLDRLLANTGFGTRAEVKRLIKMGVVSINGMPAVSPQVSIDVTKDKVLVGEKVVVYQAYVYVMLHKPAGYVSARVDAVDPTVMALVEPFAYRDLHIVGRLDKDTTGLLLLTDDGQLTHHLTSPRHDIPKSYQVVVNQPLDSALVRTFADGFSLGVDDVVKPAKIVIDSTDLTKAVVTIYEGKFHQIKRMFLKFGYEVITLHRDQVGSLSLGNLLEGQYRELTRNEVLQLKSL